MRVIVTGAHGMLGQDLVAALTRCGHEAVATDSADLDITDPEAVARLATGEFGPFQWLMNCAAYTAVDRAEEEAQAAYEINGLGPAYLAQAASMAGGKMLHVSTDFVFDGRKGEPYTEDDPPNPISAYGRSKLAGERAILGQPHVVVVRTSWLYGPHGPCFPKTIIRAAQAGRDLRVVADQVGNPTYTADLAQVLVALAEMDAFPGLYHVVGRDAMSWHGFAERVLQTAGITKPVAAIRTEEWPTPAARPPDSRLDPAKVRALGVPEMRDTDAALNDFWSRIPATER